LGAAVPHSVSAHSVSLDSVCRAGDVSVYAAAKLSALSADSASERWGGQDAGDVAALAGEPTGLAGKPARRKRRCDRPPGGRRHGFAELSGQLDVSRLFDSAVSISGDASAVRSGAAIRDSTAPAGFAASFSQRTGAVPLARLSRDAGHRFAAGRAGRGS
jgi:hypothetical protein